MFFRIALLLIVASFQNVFAREIYSFDKSNSIFENEQRFLSNLKRHCHDNGVGQDNDLLTPSEYLETYPKDIAFHYFQKNLAEICYYGISIVLKYLGDHHKSDVEKVALDFAKSCLSKKKNYIGCRAFDRTSTLFDLTVILGHYCSANSLETFKDINCRYKELKQKECSLYLSQGRPIQDCPYFYASQVEVEELHKNFFHHQCKLKWKAPRCIY